jgi:hypothetical protein
MCLSNTIDFHSGAIFPAYAGNALKPAEVFDVWLNLYAPACMGGCKTFPVGIFGGAFLFGDWTAGMEVTSFGRVYW